MPTLIELNTIPQLFDRLAHRCAIQPKAPPGYKDKKGKQWLDVSWDVGYHCAIPPTADRCEPREGGDFRLIAELFSVENELLTPTMKLNRKAIEQAHTDLVEEMYSGVV